MPTCNDCGSKTVKTALCHECAVTYSNRRMRAKGKGAFAPERKKAHDLQRGLKVSIERALKGKPAKDVPIAKVAWLERPMP